MKALYLGAISVEELPPFPLCHVMATEEVLSPFLSFNTPRGAKVKLYATIRLVKDTVNPRKSWEHNHLLKVD